MKQRHDTIISQKKFKCLVFKLELENKTTSKTIKNNKQYLIIITTRIKNEMRIFFGLENKKMLYF